MTVLEHEKRDLHEPMLRINSTGWGIRLATVVQISVLIFAGGGAWWSITLKQDHIIDKVTGTIQILERKVDDVSAGLDRKIEALSVNIERNRQERQTDITELRKEGQSAGKDITRLQEQLKNLELLLGDIRRRAQEMDVLPSAEPPPHIGRMTAD